MRNFCEARCSARTKSVTSWNARGIGRDSLLQALKFARTDEDSIQEFFRRSLKNRGGHRDSSVPVQELTEVRGMSSS